MPCLRIDGEFTHSHIPQISLPHAFHISRPALPKITRACWHLVLQHPLYKKRFRLAVHRFCCTWTEKLPWPSFLFSSYLRFMHCWWVQSFFYDFPHFRSAHCYYKLRTRLVRDFDVSEPIFRFFPTRIVWWIAVLQIINFNFVMRPGDGRAIRTSRVV